jgi:hypothetical protein
VAQDIKKEKEEGKVETEDNMKIKTGTTRIKLRRRGRKLRRKRKISLFHVNRIDYVYCSESNRSTEETSS